jgi:UDP-N-acetylmuramate dehydrogenase
MTVLEQFPEITKANVPLAPFTHLRIGGPAEFFVEPRTVAELTAVLGLAGKNKIPLRVFGGGVNLVIRDETVPGIVMRLTAPAFTEIHVDGKRVKAGCGAKLAELVSETARHGLAGFETLVGIPATVGGALRCNAGDRSGDMGQFVLRVEVLDEQGQVSVRERDELRFGEHSSNLDDPVLLSAEFALDNDSSDAIIKRMRKAWIHRRASEPLPYEHAARVFQNPRGQSATALLEQAGVARAKVGKAEVSSRNANYIVTHDGATARDVLALMELMREKVLETSGVELVPELVSW